MKFNFLLALLFAFAVFPKAQTYNQSFTLPDGHESLLIHEIDADAYGNVTLIGEFYDSLDLDPGPGTQMVYTNDPFYPASFIASYTASGSFRWGLGNDSLIVKEQYYKPQGLKVYPDGTTYFLCRIKGSTDIDPGPDTITVNGNGEAYIVKMDAGGNYTGYHRLTDDSVLVARMAMDENRNIYLTGTFAAPTMDADPGPGTKTFVSKGGDDVFLAKYTDQGNIYPAFGFSFGTSYRDYAVFVETDNAGHLFLYGTFADITTGSVNMNPDTLNPTNLTGYRSSFLARYFSSDGTLDWAYKLGSNYYCNITDMTTDSAGNIYTTGNFKNTIAFDLKNPANGELNANSGWATIFLARYDSSANFGYVQRIGGSTFSNIRADKVHIDNQDQVMILGSMQDMINFDPDLDPYYEITPNAVQDVFVAKYNMSSGDIAYADVLISSDVSAFGASCLHDSIFYIAGGFKGDLDLDPDTLNTATVTSFSPNTLDAFVAQYTTSFRDTTRIIIGIQNEETKIDFLVYPNPTTDGVTIHVKDPAPSYTVRLLDINGRIISEESFKGRTSFPVQVTGPAGIYLVQVSDNKTNSTTARVIKQ